MAGLQRLADRLAAGAKPFDEPTQLSSPIKGWNTRDALDAMDPLDAVTLENWFPSYNGCMIRNGYVPYASNVGSAPVQTLAPFSAAGSTKLLAAASGSLWDVSAATSSPAQLASGFGSDQWQTVNFSGKLFLVNGTDPAQIYDGTSVAPAAFTGLTGSPLYGVQVYQQRLYFWQKFSTGFWFGPLSGIAGPLQFYDLSQFTPLGGTIVAAVTFSHDGGAGVDDVIAFIMSSGSALLYIGNDPSNFNDWALVGSYRLSPPISVRSVCQYGAEAFLTTTDDHVPLQQQLVALKLGQLPPRSKVSGAVQTAISANPNGVGWQALYFPAGRFLLFNVPNPDGSFSQHVQNTSTPDQPWCLFSGMNGYCWTVHNNNLYFGAAGGAVYQAWTGNLDNNATPVMATAQQSWNTFGVPRPKRVTAVRPLIEAFSPLTYTFGLGFDYAPIDVDIDVATTNLGSPWNTSPWNTSPWGSQTIVSTQWSVGGGDGTAISGQLVVASAEPVTWLRTDYRFEIGNAL